MLSRDVVFDELAGTVLSTSSESLNRELILLTKAKKVDGVREDEQQPEARAVENCNGGAVPNNTEIQVRLEELDESRQLRNRATIRLSARYKINVAEINIPNTQQEAVSGPEVLNWVTNIDEELRAHDKNTTWTMVSREPGKKTIDSKWLFKIIKDPERNVLIYKGRLNVQGFMQRPRIDYNETFAVVVCYDSLRVMLMLTVQQDLEFVQLDVRTAFLYGVLDEDIHMEVPAGLEVGTCGSAVGKVNKSV